MTKLLVLFVFHEYNDKVDQFLAKSIFYDEDIDFIVICNNKSINIDDKILHDNVRTFYRDNIGYDFGGWSDALLSNDIYKNYSHFIFVNSSVIGPYIHPNYKGKWTDIYVNNLKDNIKLYGSTINANPLGKTKYKDPKLSDAHIQSYIFSMNITTLCYLIQCGLFSNTDYVKTMDDAIWKREVRMSRLIIENGWNIGSMMRMYKGVDFTFRNKTAHNYKIQFLGDVMYPRYENKLWMRDGLVFIKGNRMYG